MPLGSTDDSVVVSFMGADVVAADGCSSSEMNLQALSLIIVTLF